MKIRIKISQHEYIENIDLSELNNLKKIFEQFSSLKEPIKLDLFLISKFKLITEELNMSSVNIFSNNRENILTGKSLKINSILVREKEIKNKLLTTSLKHENTLHKGTIRSGDRISSNGDLVIIGDVNPGAIISAKKNVYVWGKLLGIAFAGEGGDKSSFISSLYLKPLQLRINNVVAIGPKDKPKNFYPEIALLEKESIVIKPLIID